MILKNDKGTVHSDTRIQHSEDFSPLMLTCNNIHYVTCLRTIWFHFFFFFSFFHT